MDDPKTRCEEHESEVSCTDRDHLNNIGVGTQILLPHCDFQVGELMDQRGTESSCWLSEEGGRNTTIGPQDQELQTRCKQPYLRAPSRSTADQPIRVWTEDAEIQAYFSGDWRMKQTDIFANESSRDLLSFLKPEDDSYKGRVQRDLENGMMRKEDNLQWKQSVSRSWWKLEPET